MFELYHLNCEYVELHVPNEFLEWYTLHLFSKGTLHVRVTIHSTSIKDTVRLTSL